MAGQSNPNLFIFSAAEVEFLAEDEMVEIVPNLNMDTLNLICGDFGPFRPQMATTVPLWLAVALKKRGKCTIRSPQWMSVENLTQVLEAERDSPAQFQPLPFHYVEISRLLFDKCVTQNISFSSFSNYSYFLADRKFVDGSARDDIPEMYMVRSLIEDIRDVRFHKFETGLEKISSSTHVVKLKNLSAMEVNIVRPFFVRALQAFAKHDSPQMIHHQQDAMSSRQTHVQDDGPRRDLRRR